MNAPDQALLPDVQSSVDGRDIAISRVGVRSLRYPLRIRTAQGTSTSVASIEMDVALPGERKGTHMSRFVEVLQEDGEALSVESLPRLLARMLSHLDAEDGSVLIRFPYFVSKTAPVSGAQSLMDYEVALSADRRAGTVRVRQKVVVPVTSLCPCSKEVSDYGAHNQRSHISIELELAEPVTIESQIRIAEEAASCELWAVLKRPDEKFVTQRAYDHPKFVEDTVRDIAVLLEQDARVLAYRVESENFESIHNHSAYALIERDKRHEP
ncbi:MAG TPA: GTP cyclohydrolase FolE2 [Burkholderiaceae bacterium]|nr:GTP cyclohydrolase FolE2 [Burkholderiaceae bacterium]